MAVVSIGRKWDATSCSNLSATTSSFDISSWPRGDHFDADDYSTEQCYEAPSTSKAEMVTTLITGLSSDDVVWTYYDPYGRIIFIATENNIDYGMAWMGRFGEKNLDLEIYKPGRYKCVVVVNGTYTYPKYFDVYDQTVNKYVHKQGFSSNNSGNSWGAAESKWYDAQLILASGNNLYVGEGDYSSEIVNLNKSMNIFPTRPWAGYHNITDSYSFYSDYNGAVMFADVGNPIEFNGTIDRWAYNSHGNSSNTVKLKIYRGGDPGTENRSTSTLIYTSDSHVETGTGWKTYSISPAQSVQRGDIIAIQSSQALSNIRFKEIATIAANKYATCAALVAGDPGNTIIGSNYQNNYAIMLRAWKEAPGEVIVPSA